MGILDDAIREHLELKRAHGAAEDEIRRKEAEAFGPVRPDAAPAAAQVGEETLHAEPSYADSLEPAAEPLGEETQLMTAADLEPLEAAPEDPYAVHPGDSLVPDEHDPEPPVQAEHDEVPPVAEAGGQMLEPHLVDPGPPSQPSYHEPRHHEDRHPAFDTDPYGHEVHPPDPVFRQSAEAPEAPTAPASEPPDSPLQPAPEDPYVGDPPYERPGVDEPPPRQTTEEAQAHEVGEFEPKDEDVLEETPEFLQDAPEHDRLWFEQRPPRDFDFGE